MRSSPSAQRLGSAVGPWTLASATAAFTSAHASIRASRPHVGSPQPCRSVHRSTHAATADTLPPMARQLPFLFSPLARSSDGYGRTTTAAMRTSLITAAAAAQLKKAMVHAAHAQALRCASSDAENSGDDGKDEGRLTVDSCAVSDPVSMAASPLHRSHAEAERVADEQESNVRHVSFGLQGSHADHCGCDKDEQTTASAVAERHRRGAPDFGRVFHQETAAWRASQERHSTLQHANSGTTATQGGASPLSSSEFEGSVDQNCMRVKPEDVPPGMSYEAYVEHLEAEEGMRRFLAQNTMHSIRRSMARDNAAAEAEAVLTTNSAMRTRLEPHQGYRGVQTLLDYNKQWAAEVSRFNPRYFIELAKEQKPEYLWIGCSDSRVPANEVVGLHPGDVFVHRNIGNIFSLSDLNCLSALQFAVDCLKVQHVIIAGHYKCGGVTAAMRGDNLGLTDHWIMQVADIKNKWWDRVSSDISEQYHLNVLCELNVLEQLSHVVNCRIVQRRWRSQNANDRYYGRATSSVYVRPEYATKHLSEMKIRSNLPSTVVNYEEELEVHGWVYSLDDGMLRPLLSLTRHSNVKKEIANAIEALFIRYSQMA
ncbi:putative Carbonic anhydrase family protein [Leptomonas seymouri]|uniref:carbonic anhydrase n=1 Tax=Leptomonas seymouri TaxID=5684 RepID=A0A0N1PC38_LEPSE|nr:putative Carbonic anhydrase family protein [Leptomonas seymouri]|eukprot:KPI86925.1 putative Carbonic anhydrase family protein [Leptomonas seymouri]